MKVLFKCTGITASIRMVLREDKWQTTAMIASQIAFPPDAIARMVMNSEGSTAAGAKSHIVARALSTLVRYGEVETRKISDAKSEYRLAAKPKTTTN